MILWQGPRRLGHAANGFAHGVEGAFRKARAVQVGAHEQVSHCRHFLVPFSRSTTGFASARGRPHRPPTRSAESRVGTRWLRQGRSQGLAYTSHKEKINKKHSHIQ